jgi:3-phenylpropionate/trans-cinnamate dioxygenase ferredoxin subunit
MSEDFQRVAPVEGFEENSYRLVSVGGASILVCRSDGQFFAVRNRCTHDHEQLVGGVIRKCSIVCPTHGARFSLKSGMPFGPPAFEPIDTFPVRVVDGHVEVSGAPKG